MTRGGRRRHLARGDRGDRRAARRRCGRCSTSRLRVADVLRRAVCVSTSRLGSGALGADRPFHRAARRPSRSRATRRATSRRTASPLPTSSQVRTPACAPRGARARARRGRHARALLELPRGSARALANRARPVHPCDLRISHSAADLPPAHLAAGEWLAWLASLDVLVSLPPEPGPGSDWCELAPAVLNGAVVVTTAESDFGPLEPGESLATADGARLRRRAPPPARRRRAARAHARLGARRACRRPTLDVSPLADAIAAVEAGARGRAPSARGARGIRSIRTRRARRGGRAGALQRPPARAATQARTGGDDRMTTTRGWDAGARRRSAS